MFKYTKRLFCDIRFWWNEIKLRRKENMELARIEDEEEWRSSMAGYGYFMTIKRNREEREAKHKMERQAIK